MARFCPIAGGCRGAAAAAMESDGINRMSDSDFWANRMRFVRLIALEMTSPSERGSRLEIKLASLLGRES